MSKNNYILELKTTKSAEIRKLIENLQAIFTKISFVFLPNKIDDDGNKVSGGLQIKEVNKFNHTMVHVKLDADNFEYFNYNYKKDHLSLGINLSYLTKCLKCMTNYDSLSMAVDADDMNYLILSLENNKDKKTIKLKLMDLDAKMYVIKSVDFPYMVTMSSTDFNKYCKDLSIVSEKMEIRCNGKKLFLAGSGEIGDVNYEVLPSVNGLNITVNTDKEGEIVQGVFSLKYLNIFSKCASFDPEVLIYIENDKPLILKYNVSSLGEIKFVLSPSKPKDAYDLY